MIWTVQSGCDERCLEQRLGNPVTHANIFENGLSIYWIAMVGSRALAFISSRMHVAVEAARDNIL